MDRRVAAVLLLLFVTGFVVRAVPVKTGTHYWDETVYLQHGEIIAGVSPSNYDEFAFRPPLMGLLLGGLFMVAHSVVAAHLLLAFLAALTIPLTFLLGQRLFGTVTGLLAAFGVVVSLEHVKLAHDVLVDPVLPVLWLGAVLALLELQETGDRRWAAATGVLCGLAVLLKFTSLVLLPAIVGLLLARRWLDGVDVRGLARDRAGWTVLAGFTVTVAPYLAWSWSAHGSLLAVFTRALQLSGAADPVLTYVTGFPQVVVPPFLLGLLLFPRWWRKRRWSVVVVVVAVAALLLPLQFGIANKELRFLFPIMPFVTVAGAAGLARLHRINRYAAPAIILLLLLPAGVGLWDSYDVYQVRTTGLTVDERSATHDAALWLRENTETDAQVYASYQWPPVAYYSKRPMTVLPTAGSFADVTAALDGPGYVFVNRDQDREPTVAALQTDSRFRLERSFGNTTFIFRYRGDT